VIEHPNNTIRLVKDGPPFLAWIGPSPAEGLMASAETLPLVLCKLAFDSKRLEWEFAAIEPPPARAPDMTGILVWYSEKADPIEHWVARVVTPTARTGWGEFALGSTPWKAIAALAVRLVEFGKWPEIPVEKEVVA
jgi:hypothetical protein